MESEEREAKETHPDEPTGNGEPPSEPYEPQRDDPIPDESAERSTAESDRRRDGSADATPPLGRAAMPSALAVLRPRRRQVLEAVAFHAKQECPAFHTYSDFRRSWRCRPWCWNSRAARRCANGD